MNLRHLKDRVNTLSTLGMCIMNTYQSLFIYTAQSLKTDQLKITAKVTDLKTAIDKQMDKLKVSTCTDYFYSCYVYR